MVAYGKQNKDLLNKNNRLQMLIDTTPHGLLPSESSAHSEDDESDAASWNSSDMAQNSSDTNTNSLADGISTHLMKNRHCKVCFLTLMKCCYISITCLFVFGSLSRFIPLYRTSRLDSKCTKVCMRTMSYSFPVISFMLAGMQNGTSHGVAIF